MDIELGIRKDGTQNLLKIPHKGPLTPEMQAIVVETAKAAYTLGQEHADDAHLPVVAALCARKD